MPSRDHRERLSIDFPSRLHNAAVVEACEQTAELSKIAFHCCHKYGSMDRMRTTVDIPDSLYRRLKSKAAREGSSVKRIILNTVEKELAESGRKRGGLVLPLVRSKRPGALHLTNEEVYDAIPFP